MDCDTVPRDDAREEQIAPADAGSREPADPPARLTLASMLGLSDDELAQPIARDAPPEHRWEQLSLGDVSESRASTDVPELRRSEITSRPGSERDLIPGLDVPGAVEVPVYLAGRAIREVLGTVDGPAPLRPPALAIKGVGYRSKTGSARFARLVAHESRVVRTIATLVLQPGELTGAFLTGHRRRFHSPFLVGSVALAFFAVVSFAGGLRPRPDRVLAIGIDRFAGPPAGVVNAAPVNLALQPAPDLLQDVATALAAVPLLWLPLMAFGVVAVAAALRAFEPHDDPAEAVFAAHFTAWFALCWGVVVPAMLLAMRFGLETAAGWEGASRLHALPDGRIDGLSASWNGLHSAIVSPHFHSALLAAGLLPWASVAWRRVFKATWLKALLAGSLIAAVPLVLLVPFA